MTDEEFLAWLSNPDQYRVVILEVDSSGADLDFDTTTYLSTVGYTSRPEDIPSNIYYEPLIRGGFAFENRISLDLKGDVSWGNIQVDNSDGTLDHWLTRVWTYRPCRAYIGDVRWPRSDFRIIFDGVLDDIDSQERNIINLKLRDKMRRLEMPIHDRTVGDVAPIPMQNTDQLLPFTIGECHNVTPVLIDSGVNRYCWHAYIAESAFEVRDNGVPVPRIYAMQPPASFSMPQNPYGAITASVQGMGNGESYSTQIADVVKTLCMEHGTDPEQRFTEDDFDQENFNEFALNVTAPVGMYITNRMTVLDACQAVAGSVGARLSMTPDGRLRLVRVEIPPIGNPVLVTESNMVAGTLQISQRFPVASAVKIGYCKNWTVQPKESMTSGIPEEHKDNYATEWLSVTARDDAVRDLYRLEEEVEQEDTYLLRRVDAQAEAERRLWLRKQQRHLFEFTGYAELMFVEVGMPMMLQHRRFGLENGKTGIVVSVAIDWIASTVKVGVVI